MRHPLAPALLVLLAALAFGLLGAVATELATAGYTTISNSSEIDTLGMVAVLTWGLAQLVE